MRIEIHEVAFLFLTEPWLITKGKTDHFHLNAHTLGIQILIAVIFISVLYCTYYCTYTPPLNLYSAYCKTVSFLLIVVSLASSMIPRLTGLKGNNLFLTSWTIIINQVREFFFKIHDKQRTGHYLLPTSDTIVIFLFFFFSP